MWFSTFTSVTAHYVELTATGYIVVSYPGACWSGCRWGGFVYSVEVRKQSKHYSFTLFLHHFCSFTLHREKICNVKQLNSKHKGQIIFFIMLYKCLLFSQLDFDCDSWLTLAGKATFKAIKNRVRETLYHLTSIVSSLLQNKSNSKSLQLHYVLF